MNNSALPTVALTPSRVPASRDEIPHPFWSFGYGGASQERIVEIMYRAQERGLEALSTDELRIEFQRARRSHRHSGGWPDDANCADMDAALNLVRERVAARGGIVGLWRGDITTLHVDVIVNAANRALSGGGGVDGAIQKAAGPELLASTLKIPEITPAVRCPVGEAILTRGFNLAASYVAHAVGPVWSGGEKGEPELLASAYRASLDLASGVGAESIAFPAISTGAYGYPQWEAAQVAVQTCEEWRLANDPNMRILLVAFDDKSVKLLRSALSRFARRV